MNIEIQALSPALLDDYMNYFDNVAFTDHKEWSGCYCVHFHWNDFLEIEYKTNTATCAKQFNREQAIKFVLDGTIQGYLAYLEGSVVGWCNANEKVNYDGLVKEKWPEFWDDCDCAEKVKSVVCFAVAPHMRGKGIATQLLNRVCADAAAQGYKYIEAYPRLDETDVYINHHGPYALYKKIGFTLHKNLKSALIVRKYL